jgi:hypothetical protein
VSTDTTEVDADAEEDTELDTSGESDVSTANTMRDRANESRIKLYVLLRANRVVVTAALALVVFGTFLVVGQFGPGSLLANLESGDTKATVFSTLLGAIITGTTLVVTISQLVISQENGPLGDQHQRMSDTMDFRDYVAGIHQEPTRVDPSAFLRQLIDETERQAKALRDAVSGSDSDGLREEVDQFTESVTGNANEVSDQLDGAKFGTFDVLFAALNFNYGWKIFQVERIGDEYEDTLDSETDEVLTRLRTTLTMFGPAREHIKTLYFEWALIDLSQYIIYTAVPALVVAGSMLAFLGSGPVPGTTLGVENALWVVAAGFTVSVFPFLLLLSYIARIATVAKRTLAIGPLILRDSQR